MIDYDAYKYKMSVKNIDNIINYFNDNNINIKDFTSIELGAYGGWVSYNILELLKPKEHYILDIWKFTNEWFRSHDLAKKEDKNTNLGQYKFNKVYIHVLDMFMKYNNVVVVRDYAERYLEQQNKNYDFIFNGINLDTEHLIKILEKCYLRLKKPGYLVVYPYKTYEKALHHLFKNSKDLKYVIKSKLCMIKRY